MPRSFVGEPLLPLEGSFDTGRMAQGEPGVPRRFRWREREWTVAEVVESRREFGDCSHGSGERYVRKHFYKIRTVEGWVFLVYFQRTFGRGRVTSARTRWRVFSVEESPESERQGSRPWPDT